MVEKRRSSNRDDDHDSVWVRSTRRRKRRRERFLLPSPEIKSRSNEGKTYIYIYRHMLYPYAELDMPTRYEANALGRSMHVAFQLHGRAMANGGKGAKWTEDCKIALPIARRFAKRPFNKPCPGTVVLEEPLRGDLTRREGQFSSLPLETIGER